MQQLSSIIAHRQPTGVLELGRDREDVSWSATPDLVGAHIVEAPERDLGEALELVTRLAAEGSTLDLVIDHSAGNADAAIHAFELFFGRMQCGGLYVIDGSLPRHIVLELMLATVVSAELVDRVEITSACVVIERGSQQPSSEPIRLRDITSDPFGVNA